jgi:hypothetical protein
MIREGFALGIIDKGLMISLLPQVHPLGETLADVSGTTNTWGGLQDDGNEDKGPFGIPAASPNTAEFLSEDGEEAAADFAGGDLITEGG